MIHEMNPKLILWIGFVLVMLGFIIPFLEVMRILESTYLLNFFAYTASVAGVFLGVIGAASLTARRRRK